MGFLRVVGSPALSLCLPEELDLLLCGNPELGDFADLRNVTRYVGYSKDSPVVRWFWDEVLGFPEVLQRRLLFFATGSDRVPINGLKSLQFCVQRSGSEDTCLPSAHTCFNVIDLPEYSTRQVLRERLLVALEHGREGFGLA